MERIESGKYVELGYDLYRVEPDGTETLVHQTDVSDPERIIFGVTRGVVAPLEKAIEGKGVNDVFDVVATAEEAFGERSDEYVVELDRDVFMVDGKFDTEIIKAGNRLPMMMADGSRIDGLVTDVRPDVVVMDFNHPLAGSAVRFKGQILAVRDATPEEIQPAHGCGCGCHHDHDHGCDDGCGCNHDHHCGDEACGCGH